MSNIFQPLKMGKETFHPVSHTEEEFVMDWTAAAGSSVPPHFHRYSDEHFTITKGEVKFTVNGEVVLKKEGETLLIPKGTRHSISNTTNNEIGLRVKYIPAADVHRMFEIMRDVSNGAPVGPTAMLKYFYIAPRTGLRMFSEIPFPVVMGTVNFVVTVIGKVAGWDKLVEKYK